MGRIRQARGDFFGERLNLSFFAVPLRKQEIGVLTIEVIEVGRESRGLIEKFARLLLVPTLGKRDLLHHFVPQLRVGEGRFRVSASGESSTGNA
jgi:hypothetical protein